MSNKPAPSHVRGPYKKGVAQRAQILERSIALVGAHGVESLALRRLANELDVTEAGLLHYFPSRNHLVMQAYEENEARADAEDRDAMTALTRLRSSVARNFGFPGIVELYSTLVVKAVSPVNDVIQTFVRRRFDSVRETLRAVCLDEQEAGTLRTDIDVDVLTALLVAATDGLQVQERAHPGSVDGALALLEQLLRPNVLAGSEAATH